MGPANATHPGDVIVLYGTGVGPTQGDETGTEAQTNLTTVPLVVEAGGRPARVLYPAPTVFPGLDQVNIVAPDGVGFGCGGSVAGNFTTIPVTATGNTCFTEGGDAGMLITDAEFDRWSAAARSTTGSIARTVTRTDTA